MKEKTRAIRDSKKVAPLYLIRMIVWTVAMSFAGFVLTDRGLRSVNSLSVTEAFLGAVTGFLLAIMFTMREKRRQRAAVVAYSIAQMFPLWAVLHSNRKMGDG